MELSPTNRFAADLIPVEPGAPPMSVRLLLEARPTEAADWKLVLRDAVWRVLAIFGPGDFKASPRLWTGRFDVGQVMAEFVRGKDGEAVTVRGGFALPRPQADTQLFSVRPDVPMWEPLHDATEIEPKKRGDAVGMLVAGGVTVGAMGVAEASAWCCTGAMVASDVMLTNWHCGAPKGVASSANWSQDVCDNTVIDLGFDDGAVRRQYSCVKVIAKSERLDYAFLRVRPVTGPGAATGEPNVITLRRARPSTGAGVHMIHHAVCQKKQLSKGCKIASAAYPAWTDPEGARDRPELTHTCATETGASGAPLFNSAGEMVALHHLGFNKGQCRVSDDVNKAVGMDAILADLAAKDPALLARLTIR